MREFFYLLFLTVSLAHATDGDLDASFGSNGDIVLTPNDASLSAYAVAVQSDGGILVAGNRWAFTQPSQQNQAVVWRFLPNGNVDSSFGSNGDCRLRASHRSGIDESLGRRKISSRILFSGPSFSLPTALLGKSN